MRSALRDLVLIVLVGTVALFGALEMLNGFIWVLLHLRLAP